MVNSITPPPELVQQWLCSDDYPWGPLEQTSITITANRLQNIATAAAQWGSDQELEACCDTLQRHANWDLAVCELMADRRPKPPTLKEQALALLDRFDTHGSLLREEEYRISVANAETIRRALEALND